MGGNSGDDSVLIICPRELLLELKFLYLASDFIANEDEVDEDGDRIVDVARLRDRNLPEVNSVRAIRL